MFGDFESAEQYARSAVCGNWKGLGWLLAILYTVMIVWIIKNGRRLK